MVNHFCTLFDKNYASRGLSMYHSLIENCPNAHLYIFAMDKVTEEALNALQLQQATIIPLRELEDPELLKIKSTRTLVEYYWTLTPSTVLYCMNKFDCNVCTYLDADIFFFSTPEVLLKELEGKDVIITEHRFSPQYQEYIVNGIYNVQFVAFRNSENGRAILQWWRERCIEWCYARLEDGKLGDQKYLDDWTERFSGVQVLQHLGGGVGPWNAQRYNFYKDQKLHGKDQDSGKEFEVVFYHFHNFKFSDAGFAKAVFYDLSKNVCKHIYQPYLQAVLANQKRLRTINKYFSSCGYTQLPDTPATIREKTDRESSKGDWFFIYDEDRFQQYEARPAVSISTPSLVKSMGRRLRNVFNLT